MKGVAYRYVGDSAKAEDVLHDAFIKMYEKIGTLKDNLVFEGWLRRIVVNQAIDFIKREKKVKLAIEESGQLNTEMEEEIPEPRRTISTKELLQALETLPMGYRMVFNLHVVDGYTHKDIGEKLGISEGTSKSQLAKAKDQLKKILSKNIQQHA